MMVPFARKMSKARSISIMDICDSHNYGSVCQENEQGYQSFFYQVVVLYPLIVEDLEYFLYKVSWIFVTLTMMVQFARKMSKATSHFPTSYRHYSIKEPSEIGGHSASSRSSTEIDFRA